MKPYERDGPDGVYKNCFDGHPHTFFPFVKNSRKKVTSGNKLEWCDDCHVFHEA